MPATSLAYPVWEKAKSLNEKLQDLQSAIEREQQTQVRLEERVATLSAVYEVLVYPWSELGDALEQALSRWSSELEEKKRYLGRQFRCSGGALDDEAMDTTFTTYEKQAGALSRQLKALEPGL